MTGYPYTEFYVLEPAQTEPAGLPLTRHIARICPDALHNSFSRFPWRNPFSNLALSQGWHIPAVCTLAWV